MATTAALIGAGTELAIIAILTHGTLTGARLAIRLHTSRPRLCSCGHGPGEHGPDGCGGRRIYLVHHTEELLDCRCLTYDAAGARAPR